MEINKETLYPYLMYSDEIAYNDQITLYPIRMKDILTFQIYSSSITVRKNSVFPIKQIIKMSYLDFLIYATTNPSLGVDYDVPDLKNYFLHALMLLKMACVDQEINFTDGKIFINGCEITPTIFDDLRQIIIVQNDIDFDINEFLNRDTEKRLEKAQKDLNKNVDKSTMEDYIDSLCIGLHITEEDVKKMTIRKFWRFVKRFNLHENYTIMRTGECSGMVTFKEPIKHWMVSLDADDKYEHLKADEKALRDKISG